MAEALKAVIELIKEALTRMYRSLRPLNYEKVS